MLFYELDNAQVYQEIMNLIQKKHPGLIAHLKRVKDMGFRGRAAYFIAYYMMKDEQNKLEKWRITNNLMDNGCSRETIEKWFNNYNEISETFFKLDRDGEIDSDIKAGIIPLIIDDRGDDDNFNDVKIDEEEDEYDSGDDDNFNDVEISDLDDPFDNEDLDDLDDFFDSLDDPFFEESNINQENEEDNVKIYKPKKDDFTDDDFGLQDVKILGNDIRI